MSEWKRVAPMELPPDDNLVLVMFEGRMEIAYYESERWYIRRLGIVFPGSVTWWRPMPEGPGDEESR